MLFKLKSEIRFLSVVSKVQREAKSILKTFPRALTLTVSSKNETTNLKNEMQMSFVTFVPYIDASF